MIEKYNPEYKKFKDSIKNNVLNFNSNGIILSDGKRNKIKIFQANNLLLNIKSFKVPTFLNQFIYKYFRHSKARRSFDYATKLINLEIGTPMPIAYFENNSIWGLKESYYVCEQLNNIFEFREIVENENIENREEIIRAFTRFTAQIHDAGIEFLDHSPGNTLIRKNQDATYSFFLVDLNRMKFHKEINLETRIKNLSKITHKKEMVEIISNEYSKILGINETVFLNKLWKYTSKFQNKYNKKKELKKKLGLK